MPLWLAVLLLLAAVAGIVLACKLLRKNRTARILCIVGCALIALACAVYIGLALWLIDAIKHHEFGVLPADMQTPDIL